jgi:hypothetical protein
VKAAAILHAASARANSRAPGAALSTKDRRAIVLAFKMAIGREVQILQRLEVDPASSMMQFNVDTP